MCLHFTDKSLFFSLLHVSIYAMRKTIIASVLIVSFIIFVYLILNTYKIRENNAAFLSSINCSDTSKSTWRRTIASYQENLILEDSIVGLISLEMNFQESSPRFKVVSSVGAISFTPDLNSPRTIYRDNSGCITYYSGVVASKYGDNQVCIEVKVCVRYTENGDFKFFTDESTEASGRAIRNNGLYINTDINTVINPSYYES